jgi:hypothetical protein
MRSIVLLAAALATAHAFANDVDPFGFEQEHHRASALTRAEVQARIRSPDAVTIKIDDQGRIVTAPSTRSRAEVAAEARAYARQDHRFGEIGPQVQATVDQVPDHLAGTRNTARLDVTS